MLLAQKLYQPAPPAKRVTRSCPELFHAFIGTGQMVAFLENDLLCYDFAVQWAQERSDTKKVATLAEQYYALLDAPHKEIVWFEHPGHTPWASESDRFVQTMVDTVLAETQGGGL